MPSTTYTGIGWHTFNVPNGVTSVTVDVKGAGGGGPDGGKGGRVQGKIAVTGITNLYCLVGQGGSVGSGTRTGGGGAAGQGHSNADGASGGGASLIRFGSTTGTVKAVAGGGGGQSGDSGDGGDGGTTTGEVGLQGSGGPNAGSNGTGGTQSQGGEGGQSAAGDQYNGHDAADSVNGTAGAGGEANSGIPCHGGGGGGGGYRSGGGGNASAPGYAPGGGGGGGSNFVGGMTSTTNTRGGGAAAGNNGTITITWTTPPPGNQPPSTPTNAKVNNVAESDGMATKDIGTISIKALIDDPDAGDKVRLVVRMATKGSVSGRFTTLSNFGTYVDYNSGAYQTQNTVATVQLPGLVRNTRYYLRLYTRDEHGKISNSYNTINFWTNRTPNPPTLVSPPDNVSISVLSSVMFDWTHSDPDPSDSQTGFQLEYRTAATALLPAGPWVRVDKPNETDGNWTLGAGTFQGNTFYEWRVRTKDELNQWGVWATPFSFFSSSTSSPPRLVYPLKDIAIDAHLDTTFRWRFIDPDEGDAQAKADFRYRVVGTEDWFTLLGDVTTPGGDPFWLIEADTFTPGYHYEWQVRTYDTISASVSDWSASGSFWAIDTPGWALDNQPVPENTSVQGSLGCGVHSVFVFAQGGKVLLGEITPVSSGTYNRVRDDISNSLINISGFGPDCGALLKSLRCWTHEIVIFRNGIRVWEGPITRITNEVGSVQIEAKDVMAYVYRRIMRQGYNDSYRLLQGEQVGLTSVVNRAKQIIVNALAPYDPNVLPYLNPIEFATDARQSRVVPDYSKTAWEEVDDLAATAGLDYTTVGRRIILWDTHRAIGKLPQMRDGDFSNSPIVTEYGMSLANYFAVTNGSGVWGAATPENETVPFEAYGPIEQLASAYGESAAASAEVLTPAARLKLIETLEEQAQRNIAGRWPTPLIVRVPDNSTLNPQVGIGFDQLIPGVHIPLRSDATLRVVEQWQKLDSVGVTFDPSGEKVAVVMSPAPNAGEDPDATVVTESG